MPEVTIILPTFNEAGNIKPLIEGLLVVMADFDAEILVVDDNSPDGTSAIVEQICKRFDNVRLMTRYTDCGLVASIKAGIAAARSEIVVWMDADQSMQPSDVPRLVAEIRAGADMAFGSRYVEGGCVKGGAGESQSLFHIFLNVRKSQDSFGAVVVSMLGNFVMRHILDKRFCDYTSGFYAVRRSLFDRIELEGYYLDYCITLLHKANIHNYKISEIPVTILARRQGESKTALKMTDLIPIIYQCYKSVFRLKRYKISKDIKDEN